MILVELRRDPGRRLQDGKDARALAQPGIEHAQAFEHRVPGEMSPGRSDQRVAVARKRCRDERQWRSQPPETNDFERVVHGEGIAVVHENAGFTGGAGARPDSVAFQQRLTDALLIGEESTHHRPLHPGVGKRRLEMRHQLAFCDWRQTRKIMFAGRQPAVQIAVEGRVLAREADQLCQPSLGNLFDVGASGMQRPPDIPRSPG